MNDQKWMRVALKEALKGRMSAPPNPWVGCILVKEGEIVGRGYHDGPGMPHAEIMALDQASGKTKGADCYITLEPCVHYGRTPPCVDRLIKSKVHRVIIAIEDPDEKMRGRGIGALQDAGIEVVLGVLKERVAEDLAPYLHHRRYGRPFIVMKAAISADGRIAAKDGSSRWISCPKAQKDAHLLRAESQAILIGSGTQKKDLPQLTIRHVKGSPPLRVLLDSRGTCNKPSPLFDTTLGQTIVVTTDACCSEALHFWKACGAEVVISAAQNGRPCLQAVLKMLAGKGVMQLLVEGGSTLFTSLIADDLIDRLILYVGPKLLGDKGKALFTHDGILSMERAVELKLQRKKTLGDTVRLDYMLKIS